MTETKRPPLTWKKKLLFYSIIVFACFVFVLILGEIYCRTLSKHGYITPGIERERSLEYTASVFSRLVLARKYKIAKGWANHKWEINERGFRGADFDAKKPEGTVRIMFYGGSAVFDMMAPQGKDWPRLTGMLLHEMGHPEVETINAGVPGMAAPDSLGRFFAEGHTFDPDYVLLGHAWNDIKYFKDTAPILHTFRPYTESSDFRVHYFNSLDRFLCETSQLFVRLRSRYFNWKYNVGNEGIIPEGNLDRTIEDAGVKQFRLTVETFVDAVRNARAVPILMTQPRLVTRDNTEEEKKKIYYEYQQMNHETLCRAFEIADEVLNNVAQKKNVLLIDAAKQFSGIDHYFMDHVHTSEVGSAVLAEFMAKQLDGVLTEK